MRGVPRERRASSAGGAVLDRHVQNPRRSPDDFLEIALVVELEPVHDAEPRPQRRRQQPRARRRADQGEFLQRHLHRSRARPLADHDVELVVLERRIENLFDRRRHAVNLVDEQHVALAEVRQDARQIARLLEHRPGGRAHGDAQLVADDVGERRLAETGRAVEQHVIERLAALRGRGDRHLQVLADAILADVVVEARGRSPASSCASSSTRAAVTRRSFVTAEASLRDFSQGLLQRPLEARVAADRLEGRIDRLLGERPMIPQVHQRGEQIVAHAGPPRRVGVTGRRRTRARGNRSFSSSTMRSDVFLPTPGIAVSRATSPRSIAPHQIGRLDAGQHRQRELRTDAADADQPLEQIAARARVAKP